MPNRPEKFRPSYLPDASKVYDSQDQRKEDNAFYTGRTWRACRAHKLRLSPVCEACKVAPATQVDHVIPRKVRPDLSLTLENLAGLCQSCHSKKTRRERNQSTYPPTLQGDG